MWHFHPGNTATNIRTPYPPQKKMFPTRFQDKNGNPTPPIQGFSEDFLIQMYIWSPRGQIQKSLIPCDVGFFLFFVPKKNESNVLKAISFNLDVSFPSFSFCGEHWNYMRELKPASLFNQRIFLDIHQKHDIPNSSLSNTSDMMSWDVVNVDWGKFKTETGC